tara:strand:- start:1066 stop:1512 length:447 start_codon:yes stop_codon:yes gene_type:complete
MIASLLIECNQDAPGIFLDICLNDKLITSNPFTIGKIDYIVEFTDTDAKTEQCIKISMRGKTATHTKIDEEQNIVSDIYAMVHKIVIDEIEVTELYTQGNKCYYHIGSNSNKNGPILTDEFYGYIGINGDVLLNFYTPLWHWFNSKCS